MKNVKNMKLHKKNQFEEKEKKKLNKNFQKNKILKNKFKKQVVKVGKEEMLELQNIDFDKADEALLKAKKKTLDDAFKKVDREDVLFAEIEFSDQEGEIKNVLPGRKANKHKNINVKEIQAQRNIETKRHNESIESQNEKKPANKKENTKKPKKLILHENVSHEKKLKLESSIENKDDTEKKAKKPDRRKEKFARILEGNLKPKQVANANLSPKMQNVDLQKLSKATDNLNKNSRKLNINDICPTNNEEEASCKKKRRRKNEKDTSLPSSTGPISPITNSNSNIETNNIPNSNNSKRSTNIRKTNSDPHLKEKLEKLIKNNNRRRPLTVDGMGLRQRMLERVKAAQFRLINETLYTSSGMEAKQLFQTKPEAFQAYHEGFRQQVKKWPINPLTEIIKRVRALPKSHVIADMGCGDATLAKSVPHKVHSFDLVACSPEVVSCDIAKTPLQSESVDVVVFCLALMGTELQKYLAEANRVLKMKGKMLIAEVESRFEDVNGFLESVERLGFKVTKIDQRHKVFLFLEFTKVANSPHKRPQISLKPCLYKKR